MNNNIIIDEHILNIIQNNEIFEQSDLQKTLKERGHNIPQATLSRKLKKLKIAKISGIYKVTNPNQHYLPLVLNIQISEFGLIILHTYPGQANSLAYFLDQKYVNYFTKDTKNLGILGTIAGDDTVLLIMKNKSDLDGILTAIYQIFPYLVK